MKICFATNNQNKLKEIKAQLSNNIELLSLTDIGCLDELPENQDTLEGNSKEKATFLHDKYGINCFADDTGLEVEALNGEPGVYSARYAGPQRNNEENIKLLLSKLEAHENKKARFRTVISLYFEGGFYQFEGIVEGKITHNLSGTNGFGYDPIFIPKAKSTTFAEMNLKEKNSISHRGRAFSKLIKFLSDY